MERNENISSLTSPCLKGNDDVALSASGGPVHASGRRPWQTPDMEIVLVSVTASGRGAVCEGSVFTNTS